MSNKKLEYWVIDEDDELPFLKPRKRVPYNEILRLLIEGHEIFIECDRKMAYYYKKQFEKRLGIGVVAYPAIYKKKSGYVFRLSIVDVILNRESDELEQDSQ
ncbi:MAG: hypothetical protein J7M38_10230 [Armatimonadetes bacterium]|nr:hypothetical protein [Armatimonadota bacterium]